MDRQEIYKRLQAAKDALKPKHPDAATLKTVVSDKAADQYWKQARRLFGTDPTTGEILPPKSAEEIIEKVCSYEVGSTVRKYARSVRHAALISLGGILKMMADAQRASDWSKIERIVSTHSFHALTVLAALMPADYVALCGPLKSRIGKKSSLRGLPDNWQEMIAMASSPESKYHLAALVCLITGCRPAELEKGVLLERVGNAVNVTIQGAKVRENAGQPRRRFRLADHPITEMLKKEIALTEGNKNSILVQVKFGNSVSTHIRACGEKLWPKRKKKITAYTARHAIAGSCKKAIEEGANPDVVSQVLGHAVDTTASYYGNRSQAKGKSVTPSMVQATRPIRHNKSARNADRVQEGKMPSHHKRPNRLGQKKPPKT